MRQQNPQLEQYRQVHPTLGESFGMFGYFVIPVAGEKLNVISSGCHDKCNDWEHVSVSLPTRCPMWHEMQRVKELFWEDAEEVAQFHPAKSEHVNTHPFCLHLWRHKDGHPMPPIDHV